MKALKTLALAASLVLAAAALPALAQPGHGGGHGMHRGMPGMPLMHLLDDVDATEAQREQIRSIYKTAREELRGQMQDGRGQHQQMLKLWAQPNIDAVAMDALRKQQQAQQERVAARMQAAFIEAGRVLSPAQRAQIAEKAAKRAERMKQRMEKHRGEHAGKL